MTLIVLNVVCYAIVLGGYFGAIEPWMNRRHGRRMREKYDQPDSQTETTTEP